MKKLLALSLSAALLNGCTSLGEEDYACDGTQEDPRCVSTTEVYELSLDGKPVTKERVQQHRLKGGTDAIEPLADPVIRDFVSPQLPNRPVPVRTPATVMRIWFSAWEDESGALFAPGLVYNEVEPRRWVIGRPLDDTGGRLVIPYKTSEKNGE